MIGEVYKVKDLYKLEGVNKIESWIYFCHCYGELRNISNFLENQKEIYGIFYIYFSFSELKEFSSFSQVAIGFHSNIGLSKVNVNENFDIEHLFALHSLPEELLDFRLERNSTFVNGKMFFEIGEFISFLVQEDVYSECKLQ